MFRFTSIGYSLTFLLVGGEGAEEGLGRPLPVHGPLWCAVLFWGLHAAGPGLVLGAGLACRVEFPALVQQAFDLGRHLGHRARTALSSCFRARAGSAAF